MKIGFRMAIMAIMACFALNAVAQPPAKKSGGMGGMGGGFAITSDDPRVQNRTYHFADTNTDLPYCVFVSSKVKKDQKAPLVVTLHGLGAGPGIMMNKPAVDLAEENGYILVAPMGYSVGGWYGSPVMSFGASKSKGGAPFGGGDNPPNLAELSEKDVMNVIDMIRKEFNIDDSRMYLMGHSMGGAGTLFLGSKHASMWAAIGAEAPAAFLMNENRADILKKITAPVIVVQGDEDKQVPATNTRMWVDTMKELNLNYEYKEMSDVDHGVIIEKGVAPIYEFFARHVKK